MNIFKKKLYVIVFEADTFAGKLFDLVLIGSILFSTLLVMLESVEEISKLYSFELHVAEWFVTIVFSAEYIIRLWVVTNKLAYARSFFGVIDLLSILPSYIDLLIPGARYLMILRILRLLRIFRILKLFKYVRESTMLMTALRGSKIKITIFVFVVLNIALIFGALMYVIEGPENGFTSIPRGIYWAIVTLSTVGYGDISPNTILGQIITTVVIILGYGIIAVPTGIISVEMGKVHVASQRKLTKHCPSCMGEGHDHDALFCKKCGASLQAIHENENTSRPD